MPLSAKLSAPVSESLRDRAATNPPTALQNQPMLSGPLFATMIRLAAPTTLVLIIQASVGVAETYFISFLGTNSLAGAVLVFPLLALALTVSNGGIGGGVASLTARAVGARHASDANDLTSCALILGIIFGALFTGAEFFFGHNIYTSLGGTGPVLDAAIVYGNLVFLGAVPLWVSSLLGAALRGTGNVRTPALISTAWLTLIVVSPALIFGWGPIPRLGIAGAGVAMLLYNLGVCVTLIWYIASGRGGLSFSLKPDSIRPDLLKGILWIGGISSIASTLPNLTIVLVTGAAGLYGADALAGYGIASRVDFLLMPLLFGLGTSILTMVGANLGAGAVARARRVAWLGSLTAAAVAESIGLTVAIFPETWMSLFATDPSVISSGAIYLRAVGPVYGAFGIGLAMYFVGQGAGVVMWPAVASTTRFAIAGLGGWILVIQFGARLETLYLMVQIASLGFGVVAVAGVMSRQWGREGSFTSQGASS